MKKLTLLGTIALILLTQSACTNFLRSTSNSVQNAFNYIDTGVNKPDDFPILRSTGYAVISRQRGPSNSEKYMQAMRASKLDAYRELSEQVYGVYVKSNVRLNDTVQTRSSVQGDVEGVIHGARVIRQYPSGDSYVTELELDTKVLYDMYQMRGAF